MHLLPGDVAQLLLGDHATNEQLQRLREQLGLDQPVWVQYGRFMLEALRGDLGVSIQSNRPALDDVLAGVSGDAAACAGVAAAGEPVRCAGGRAGGDAAGLALRRGGDDADPVRRVDADLLARPDAAGAVRRRPGLAAGGRADAGRARSAAHHRHERDRQPAVRQRHDDRRQPAAYAAAGGDAGQRAAGADRAHHARRGAVGGNGGSCAHRAGEGSDGCAA